MFDESIVGEPASLGQTVYVFSDFEKNVSLVDELEFRHCAGTNVFDGDSQVLVMIHGSVQVEVFYVDRHEFCIGNGSAAGVLTSPGP